MPQEGTEHRRSAKHWVPLLAGFLTGQAAVQLISFLTGILILRLLSIEEYAVYTLAAVIQGVGSVDFGTSQGVISIGAAIKGQSGDLSSLLRAALRLRARIFLLMSPAMIILAFVLFRENGPTIPAVISILGLVALNVWAQQSATLATAVLNIRHDSRGLLRAGVGSGTVRLLLIWGACSAYPYAITAVAVNMLAAALSSHLLWAQCGIDYSLSNRSHQTMYRAKLLRFAMPLVPSSLYLLCNSQISSFLLALAGATTAIAEVGALGRLVQLISLVSLLNGFFVIPYFARIDDKREFARRAWQALLLGSIAGGILVVSAMVIPQAWLIVLGPNYRGLANDVVLVVAAGAISLAGSVVYAMVLAARVTKRQWIGNALGLAAQLVYVWQFDIVDTRSALILNLIPLAVAFTFQCTVLFWFMFSRDRISSE